MTVAAGQARDEVFALIRAAVLAWDATVKVYWEGKLVPTAQLPTLNDTWVRVSMQHVDGRQESLAGGDGLRRWNRVGFVTAQCFAPLSKGSVARASELASVVRDALQGRQTESCVWFKRPRITEVGEDRDWFNVNATIDFDYDELR